ncbi:MAG: sensor domain-containing diguanylate cyclase [Synergistaceae bacterium]|jgi:diguanylate cyclase (GGDEF)-like protein|nr:sensor domain-containing diguanylate cyclase [Synergistaceae bacterium]
MRKALLLFSLILFLSASVLPAFSDEEDSARSVEIDELEFLVLSERTLAEVGTAERYAAEFRPVADGIVRFMNFDRLLWVRVPASRLRGAVDSFGGRDTVLVLDNEQIARADCFLPSASGGYRHLVSGLALSGQSLPLRRPVFPLEDLGGEGYAYICVRAIIPVTFSLSVFDEDVFHHRAMWRLTGYMAFYSFMAAWAMTYFFFYAITRDRHYLITFVRQLAACVFLFSFKGYMRFYSGLSPRAVYILVWSALGMHCVMASLFCREQLPIDAQHLGSRLVFFHAALGVLMIVSSFMIYPYLTFFLTGVALAAYIASSMLVGIAKYRRGYRRIVFFLFSCLCFSVALVCLTLNAVRATAWSEHAFMIGFLLDPLLLACMLIPESRERIESYFYMGNNAVRYEKISRRDDATGFYNKAHILYLLDEQVKNAQKAGDLAFMLLDIDGFKKFNEAWGHPEGDKMVVLVAHIIRQCLRVCDIASRYGGEEFGVILPGGTLPTSILVAERIRKTIERESTLRGDGKRTTLSIGLAFFMPGDTAAALVRRADDALVRARTNGSNRTEFAGAV